MSTLLRRGSIASSLLVSGGTVSVSPLAAVGAGVGVAASITLFNGVNVQPNAAVGSGVGNAVTVTIPAVPHPLAAVGSGAGVKPSITVGNNVSVSPLAATASGVGIGPVFGGGSNVNPLAAQGSGVAIKGTIAIGPDTVVGAPVAMGIGVGVSPAPVAAEILRSTGWSPSNILNTTSGAAPPATVTMPYAYTKVGDFAILGLILGNGAAAVSSITSNGGYSNQWVQNAVIQDGTNNTTVLIWLGTVLDQGVTDTLTITYANANTVTYSDLYPDCLTCTVPINGWATSGAGNDGNGASVIYAGATSFNNTYPQAAWGIANSGAAVTGAPNQGFSDYIAPNSFNQSIWRFSLAENTAYQPASAQDNTYYETGFMVLEAFTSVVPVTSVSPTAAVGSGVGVKPTPSAVGGNVNIHPAAAIGSGIGITPATNNTLAVSPLAALGAGVGVNPTIFTGVPAPSVTALSVAQGPVGGGTQVVITGTSFAGLAPSTTKWIFPVYQYPTDGNVWSTIGSTTIPAGVEAIVIANVNTGPGSAVDSNYTTVINNARAAGWTVYGYIETYDNNGTVTEAQCTAQVDDWYNWYGVTNIYWDDVDTVAANLSFYTALTTYVHSSHGGKSFFNQGAPVQDNAYLSTSVADGIVVFEHDYATFASTPPPSYAGETNGVLLGYQIFACSQAEMNTVLSETSPPAPDFIYCTDQVNVSPAFNPYDGLPSYYAAENTALTQTTSGVMFGNSVAASYTVNSLTQITAVSPPHAAGQVYVSVHSASGTSGNVPQASFTFTTVSAPTVTGVNPNSGPSAGGTSVTITGTGFSAVTAVKFGTVPATSYTVNSATSITAHSPPNTPPFATKVATNGRYIEDQYNNPWFMVGDSAWALMAHLNPTAQAAYFAERQSQGFNAILLGAFPTPYIDNGGSSNFANYNGVLPFTAAPSTSNWLSSTNAAYWTGANSLLAMIQLAATYGMTIFLDPFDTGYLTDGGSGGSSTYTTNNSTGVCHTYGAFLGTTFGAQSNVVWMNGNDYEFDQGSYDQYILNGIAAGIQSTAPHQLQTMECLVEANVPSTSDSDTAWAPVLGSLYLNGSYCYTSTYVETLLAYTQNVGPAYLNEGNYEGENNSTLYGTTTAFMCRAQAWWACTTGGGGGFYGNHWIWGFLSGYASHFTDGGAVAMTYLAQFFKAIAWQNLVPDSGHTFLTAGYGTSTNGNPATDSYCTGAIDSAGTVGVVYVPQGRTNATTVTIALSKFSGSVTAQWYDPSLGAYTTVAGGPFANTGTHAFTIPSTTHSDGSADWVLLLQG